MGLELAQGVITMLAVINPAISGIIHLGITGKASKKVKIIEATKSSLQILAILVLVAFAGKSILNAFGIHVETFRIVGGIIIAYIGFTMLTGKIYEDAKNSNLKRKGKTFDNSSLVMFAASPGTIATLITLSVTTSIGFIPFTALISVLIAMVITWGVLVVMSSFPHKESRKHSFLSQVMGVVLIAMGLQFALMGIKTFFAL